MTNKDFIFKVPSFLRFKDELKPNELAITITESEFISDQIAELNKVSIYGDTDNSVNFFNEYISIIDKSGKGQRIQKGISGMTESELTSTLESLDHNCELTCLEAYLREAIKHFDKLKLDLSNFNKYDYMNYKGYTYANNQIFIEDVIYSEDLGTIADYIKYQTYASYYGNRVLHKSGLLSTARIKLRDVLKKSNSVNEVGNELVLTEYEPTIPMDKLDDIFFKLQGIQRNYQVKFNSLKRKLDDKSSKKHKQFTDESLAKSNELTTEFNNWKSDQESLLNNLKIVIPLDFINIYNNIKSKLNK